MEQSKRYFWVLLDLVLAALVVNLVFFVMPAIREFSNSFYPTRTVSFSAEGKAVVAPDVAETTFSVVSEGADPSALAEENNRRMNEAIDFVKGEGIDDKDVKTTGYNLSPRYEYDEARRRSFISGYTLTQSVTVKIRDFTKINLIMGGLPELGINQISNVNFTVDDPETFLAEAREEAFEKVRAKADTMSRQVGVKLGRVVNFSESTGGYPVPYYGRAEGLGGDMGPTTVVPKIEPGSEELVVTVYVTYEIE